MAAKNTSQLIPLCHPLPLTAINLEFVPKPEAWAVDIRAKVSAGAAPGWKWRP